MKTISSSKERSLISWQNNKNGSNEFESRERNEMLRSLYISFFRNCLSNIKPNYLNFCRDWLKYCNSFEKKFIEALKNESIITKEWQEKMWYKFRGNVFEIFLEKLFLTGTMTCEGFTTEYIVPDDRCHEDYTDAYARSGKFLVGIQAKNHSWPIKQEYFDKADSMYAREIFSKVTVEDFEEYKSAPRQFIVSMSALDDVFKNMHHEYDGRVKFIGPDILNKVFKSAKPNLEYWFNEIIMEIENFSY